MQQARFLAGCTVVGDLICVAGRKDKRNYHSSVEAYNTKTGTWENMPPMSQERFALSCASLKGELHVLGGYTGEGLLPLSSCEKYNFVIKSGQFWAT